jgi:integrase/recombinase XerC
MTGDDRRLNPDGAINRSPLDRSSSGHFTERDNKNAPAARQRSGADTEGMIFDARKTLRPPRSLRERMEALMRDVQHEQAAAYPELAEWIDFLDVEGKSPRTLYTYTREVALLLREHPDTAFAGLTAEQINSVLALKPTRSRYITRSIFNVWFEWGIAQDKLDRNPMRKVAKPKHPYRRKKSIFTEGEVARLENLPSPDGPLLRLMFATGIRKAGCRNLRLRDIDLEHGLLVVTEKGSKERPVPLGPLAQAAIADLALTEGLNPDDYLWYSKPGGRRVSRRWPIGDTTFDRWWHRVLADADVRYLNIHQTRHTYGNRLREKGIDLELRKELMGHESIKTTDYYYGRVTFEDAAAAVKSLW